ncbi:substrate-binding domain-containing protein [Streptomyces sp. NPDC003710]
MKGIPGVRRARPLHAAAPRGGQPRAKCSSPGRCGSGWTTPPLTTVHVSQQEIGAEAARMLLKCIGQPNPPRSLLLGGALVVRASTGPVPHD